MNKNILIVISTNEYLRNYIETDAFNELAKNYNCKYLISNKINSILFEKNNLDYEIYQEDAKQTLMSYNFFITLMFKYRKKSSSFNFRIKRLFPLPGGVSEIITSILKEGINYKFITIKRVVYRFYKKILSSNLIFPIYKFLFYKKHKLNNYLINSVNDFNPSLIIFPSSAYDPIGIDIAFISKKNKNIKSFFLIDNWDNLSSKSILFEKPNYLGVWSKQSLGHAIDIQGFDPKNVFIIGTPRYNHYFLDRKSVLKSHFAFKYILFVGTAVEFDEEGVLVKLNNIIEKNKNIFNGIKIVYRPHPWRQSNMSILDLDLKNIVIDPQLLNTYSKNDKSSDFQPGLNYYSSLIQNSEFVIGGLTSMLIESIIFRKPYFALAYDDKKNLTSQHNMLKNYVHFRGIENIDAIYLFKEINNLDFEFISYFKNYINIDLSNVDSQREYFLFQDQFLNYNEMLLNTVNKII